MHRLEPETAGQHLGRLYRAAWAFCGDREEAEDLVQETYARVLARPRFVRAEDDLGYLLSALRNTFILELRSRKRRPRGERVTVEFDPIDQRDHMRPEVATETREVLGAIAALPRNSQATLVAVDVIGLSHREAAVALGVPIGTVRSRLSRARARVADE